MSLNIQDELIQHLEQNYNIEKELGRGGMGVVYLAQDRRLERPVAIKVLQLNQQGSNDMTEEMVERFQREAKVVARMSHPNLVGVYDVGEVGNYYYMIQEFADGKPLSDLIANNNTLPPPLVTSIGAQICQALMVAHEQNIIHRDIKPANIILSPKGVAKLTDFGIAQLNQDSGKLTQAGSMMGSLMYASPEQVQDASSVDTRTDVYSLGVTLYELLTGKSPYQAEQLSQVILEIMSGQDAPSASAHNPEIPESLSLVIQQAMRKPRDERYQSADQMNKDLNKLLQSAAGQTATFQITFAEGSDSGSSPRTRLGDSTLMRRTRIDQELVQELRTQSSWVPHLIKHWKKEALTQLKTQQVLDKVMEPNLFGAALSGALIVDDCQYLFIYNGFFVGAIDLESGVKGSDVFAKLPPESNKIELRLAEADQVLAPLLIANILEDKGEVVQSKLDSSLMDLAPLIENFASEDEPFTGYVVCSGENNVFYYGFDQGKQIFAGQAKEEGTPEDTFIHLTKLAVSEGILMNVYWAKPEVIGPSLKAMLADTRLQIGYKDENKSTLRTLCDQGDDELPIHLIREAKENIAIELKAESSPAIIINEKTFPLTQQIEKSVPYASAKWLVNEYFYLLNSSGNTGSLKYIYSWLPSINHFSLEESLKGDDGEHYRFSLVGRGQAPGDDFEKVLLLLRVGPGTKEDSNRFIDEVITVKKNLIKSGDIGGAIYISKKAFDTDALKLFYERTVEPRKKGFGLGALDRLTKYKGFVRIGMNRGFHLNLIEYSPENQNFEVIAPLLK